MVAKPGTVLVIDDEFAVREAVVDILEFSEMPALAAADGREGLALLREHGDAIGLVVLDFSMPGLSGAETFAGLRALSPNVPVIVASGYDQSEESLSAIAADPAVVFLRKPYHLFTLVDVIRRRL